MVVIADCLSYLIDSNVLLVEENGSTFFYWFSWFWLALVVVEVVEFLWLFVFYVVSPSVVGGAELLEVGLVAKYAFCLEGGCVFLSQNDFIHSLSQFLVEWSISFYNLLKILSIYIADFAILRSKSLVNRKFIIIELSLSDDAPLLLHSTIIYWFILDYYCTFLDEDEGWLGYWECIEDYLSRIVGFLL